MDNLSPLILLIVTPDGRTDSDVQYLADGIRERGHTPVAVPWTELSVSLDENGPRLCSGGAAAHVDGIIHRLTADALGGLAIIEAVEDDVPSVNSAEAVLRSADTFATAVRMVAHGIPAPATAYCPNDRELAAFADRYGYPVVLRRPECGAQTVVARSAAELLHQAAAVRGQGRTLLVQRHYAEAAGREHRALVVGGSFVSACERLGRPGGGCRPVTLSADEIDLAQDAARAAGLDLMSATLLRTADGPLVLETDACPGLGGHPGADARKPLLDLIERAHALRYFSAEGVLTS